MTPAATENPENLLGAAPVIEAAARPSTAGMTTKVVKGSLWTLAGQVAPLAVSLVATPFTIRLLGAESYGVLILVGLIPTYLGFADFGMSIASTKFASEAYAEGDTEKEARIVRTAALIALCASLPFGIAIFALSGWLVTLFNVPEHLLGEASLALKIASVTFIINFLNGIFNTPQLTRLRMDLNTFVTSGFRILGLIATPITLYLGFGIVGAVLILMLASILTLLGHLVISGRLDRHLFELSIERSSVRSLLKFGVALVGAAAAALTLSNLEKLILPSIVSIRALAYYTVAFTLASMMTMFSNSMIQSLIPAFSQLQKDENKEQLQSLYSRGIRLNLMWLVPSLVILSIIAKPFFTVWAGADFGRESVLPFYILLGGVVFNIPAYLPYAAIMAAGRTDVFAKLYFSELVLYVVLVSLFTYKFGILGAAAAWSIRIISDAALLFVVAKKVVGVNIPSADLRTILGAALTLAIPFLLNLYYQEVGLAVISALLIGMTAYLILLFKVALRKEEVDWLILNLKGYLSR